MICDRCYFNTNCQYIGRNKKSKVSGCSCFKDRELVVELPCKFGEMVYVLMSRGGTMETVKGTVKNIRRYADDTWWLEFSDLWVDKTLDDFGKTVFLTEPEALAKLEEIKG